MRTVSTGEGEIDVYLAGSHDFIWRRLKTVFYSMDQVTNQSVLK